LLIVCAFVVKLTDVLICKMYVFVCCAAVASPVMRAAVLWAFCYETSDVVSAEACHAVTLLDLDGTDVIDMLQQRYFAEDSDIVRR